MRTSRRPGKKMKHESWSKERAESFLDRDAVKAYRHRAPYPDETFEILRELIKDEPRHVLDVGCGTGAVARNILDFVDCVDALDPSSAMIEEGKMMPGGNSPRIRWILGNAEDAVLDPPYAQIVAAMSIHWLDWNVVMPRFASTLTPNGYLAIIYNSFGTLPWEEDLRTLRRRTRGYEYPRPTTAPAELVKAGLFEICGEKKTAPEIFRQKVDDYIEQFHSRSDMARVKMGETAADEFDDELRSLLSRHVEGDMLQMEVRAQITWGRPCPQD